MYSQWSDGSVIDKCSTVVAELTAIPFQKMSFISLNNQSVQSTFNGHISLTIAKSFYYLDEIKISLPNEFSAAQISSSNFQTFLSSVDSNNVVTMNNFPNSPQTLSTNTIIILTLNSITNPMSIKPIQLTVGFYRNGNKYQESTVNYNALE
jgi:hypothetical protein